MTKLDLILERVRKLPQERQDAIAADLEVLLEGGDGDLVLSPEQEAELTRRLADTNKTYLSHDDVAAYFTKKYGA